MKKYYIKAPLRKRYKKLKSLDSREAEYCCGTVRSLQGCAVTFEDEDIRQVCRGMLRLSKEEKEITGGSQELDVLYRNIRNWICQKVRMLSEDDSAVNKEVLNDLLWNICPYWVEFRMKLEKAKGVKGDEGSHNR